MNYRNHALRRLGNVTSGALAGHYTLPTRVVDALAAVDRLLAEQERVAAQAHQNAPAVLLAQVKDAARTGKKFPAADRVVVAEQERQARELYRTALSHAVDDLENAAEGAFTGCADELITDHLRPALAEVMAEVADVAEKLRPYGLEHHRLLDAPDDARKARGRLDALTERYRAIRAAQSAIGSLLAPLTPEASRTSEVRNVAELTAGYNPGKVPWPTEDLAAKLVWFVTNGADVWVATHAERDALAAEQATTLLAPTKVSA